MPAHSTAMTMAKLTKAQVRSFMVDYYEDFDSLFQSAYKSKASKVRRKECLTAFCEQYYTKNAIYIRPSGNPLTLDQWIQSMIDNVVILAMVLISIDNITLLPGGMAAVVVFTADQEFTFKGHPENDRTTITVVLHLDIGNNNDNNGDINDNNDGGDGEYGAPGRGNGLIHICNEHRSTGKPIPKTTRWGSHL